MLFQSERVRHFFLFKEVQACAAETFIGIKKVEENKIRKLLTFLMNKVLESSGLLCIPHR